MVFMAQPNLGKARISRTSLDEWSCRGAATDHYRMSGRETQSIWRSNSRAFCRAVGGA
jgi:hypothetical protein